MIQIKRIITTIQNCTKIIHEEYFIQKHKENNDIFQETNDDYYEIRESCLNNNSKERNINR